MTISLLYFFLAFLVAFFVAAFLYAYPKKKRSKLPLSLFLLRFLSVVAILMLLINPKWERNELSLHKPQLIVAVDNSASIDFVKGTATVKSSLERIRNHKALQEKFELSYFSFGSETKVLDSLTFEESQTDPTAFLNQIDALYADSKSPIIYISDGNQTQGESYEFYRSRNPIYPLVIGDTTQYVDLGITQLNVNQFAFLDNKFPVEIFTLYKGNQNTDAQLSIFDGNTKIFSKNLQFSKENRSHTIRTMLPANSVGQHYYHAQISHAEDEQNTRNNRKDFSIEVVDQQTNILLLSSFSHPDLGAIKKSIESNKQRKVSIEIGSQKNINFSDYQLVILYQPTSTLGNSYKEIIENKIGTIIITGTKTDWRFLNNAQNIFQKNATNLSEDYLPVFNAAFAGFVAKDIGFADLPPLQDKFGVTSFKVPFQTMLTQKIGNTNTEKSLLAVYSIDEQEHAVLFGEGFWRWRMQSKIDKQSYVAFDEFFGALVQYTAVSKKTQQLHLDYQRIRFSNQSQLIKSSYVDKNHQIDTKASIWLYLTNLETKKTEKMPFSVKGNHYEINLQDLPPNTYSFQVVVSDTDQKRTGNFKVLNYNVEQQFSTANLNKLKKLADNSGGKVTTNDQMESLFQTLIQNDAYKSIQKAKKISKPLIDWHWLLAFIILSLSTEWFIRKYRGLI